MGKCPDSYLKDISPIPVCHSSASAKEDILRHFFFFKGKVRKKENHMIGRLGHRNGADFIKGQICCKVLTTMGLALP